MDNIDRALTITYTLIVILLSIVVIEFVAVGRKSDKSLTVHHHLDYMEYRFNKLENLIKRQKNEVVLSADESGDCTLLSVK